jgi:hypothetical protein
MAVYVLVATVPWHAPDGTTQAPGTVAQRIVWDGVTPYEPPTGFSIQPWTNQVQYAPVFAPDPPSAQSVLAGLSLAEVTQLKTQADAVVANPAQQQASNASSLT